MLEDLKARNPHIAIYPVSDARFSKYGKVLDGFDFNQCLDIMQTRPIPEEGNCYVASDAELMGTDVAGELSRRFYAGMPVQIGYCNGNSSKLNALEYHKGSEVDVAVTDLVLLLSDIRNISHNELSSESVEAFFLPANTACELYATTLHFAPCKTSSDGYKSIIVLPAGTNAGLDSIPAPKCEEDYLLWMQNKWLIAHAESIPASKGAFVGITGDNIEINY
ncbi:DUF4867 family protein [Anaerobium acetethylicum]|uniref:DUF4867 domain-containing protein n=1 Tax=Anaerobium acetethylicum TaxID=1619234 RepID=A0A1D3TV28_9FIRM|nr:DUF4867 family protein [Anaerobium acetethylicum]SCP97962.1 protein of unknown function [Anaerobium acetethylicum]